MVLFSLLNMNSELCMKSAFPKHSGSCCNQAVLHLLSRELTMFKMLWEIRPPTFGAFNINQTPYIYKKCHRFIRFCPSFVRTVLMWFLGVLIQKHLLLHQLLGKEFEKSLNSLVCPRKRLWQMMLAGETAWKWRAAPSWLLGVCNYSMC